MEDKKSGASEPRKISLLWSIVVFAFLILSITFIVLINEGPISLTLLIAAVFAAAVAIFHGYKYADLQESIFDSIRGVGFAVIMYISIGILVGTWILGGIIPSLIYYGLSILNVKVFFFISLLICSVFSVATGSSWSTAGTVGIALMGVGVGLGVPLPLTAGVIVSGAYFGDKLSPVSDTTILASSASGTDVFTHMRHMLHTTLPAYVCALILYLVVGFFYSSDANIGDSVAGFMSTLDANFVISPWLMLPVLVMAAVIILKVPAVPGVLLSGLIGMLCAGFVQGRSVMEILNAACSGVSIDTGMAEINRLVNRGGMESMLSTMILLLSSCCFTGVVRRSGMLQNVIDGLMKRAKTDSQIVLTTQATAFFANVATGDSNVANLLTASMYKDFYEEHDLAPQNLSRAAEDLCTLSAPLIPWTSCGVYMSGTLGIATLAYLPYTWFNLISILFAVILAITGKDIPHISTLKAKEKAHAEA